MKKTLLIFCLIVFFASILDFNKANYSSKREDVPIIIYYCLNTSHSRSWAQINKNGVVGISYFQHPANGGADGTLIYKTIQPDGSENLETITTGIRLEKSVLLFDSLAQPHIFVATSDNSDQVIDHYYKNESGQWQSENIIHFYNEGGKFIYELSADTGPDYSFHLLILKTRSNVDSDDYNWAWLDSYLYHLTNVTGSWQKELIRNYDMAYTYDTVIRSSGRQDIKVDKNGHVHITFSEQINANDDPSRLWYATNKSGTWVFEIALNHDYGIRDDAGWFPSLCLDNNGTPYISCMYINRVYTYSAVYCKLFLLKRLGESNWHKTVIAEHDDGYYGYDGRNYTGGLSHLVFDKNNIPHIIFSDVASTHWPSPFNQCQNVGNIRYGILENGVWNIKTIYRQPLPTGYFNATEIYGLCLLLSDEMDSIRIIGQELAITGVNQYSNKLLSFSFADINDVNGNYPFRYFKLNQNYPNPFNGTTLISYSILQPDFVIIKVYDTLGREIQTLVNEFQNADLYTVYYSANQHASGIYFYVLNVGNEHAETKKMVLLR